MKRSALNHAYREALACFARHHWRLPPRPRWDITDFGLGDFTHFGLTLVNLATEPEYCEKLMYARRGQTTPCHAHARKKEDINWRAGKFTLRLWPKKPAGDSSEYESAEMTLSVNGEPVRWRAAVPIELPAGFRITLGPGVWHEFYPTSDECIIGEVSAANNDRHDNIFLNPEIGRFPGIEEDEPALVRLLSEK